MYAQAGVDRTNNDVWYRGMDTSSTEYTVKHTLHIGDQQSLNLYTATFADHTLGYSVRSLTILVRNQSLHHFYK